jgi:hypothetical protein
MPGAVLEDDWVIDLDIQKFFDSVDHALMVKAVQAHADVPWVVLYVIPEGVGLCQHVSDQWFCWLSASVRAASGKDRGQDGAPAA